MFKKNFFFDTHKLVHNKFSLVLGSKNLELEFYVVCMLMCLQYMRMRKLTGFEIKNYLVFLFLNILF